MSGLVLLDEEQHRALYAQQQPRAPAPAPPPPRRRVLLEPQQYVPAISPRASRPTHYTNNQGLPRTDFTSARSSGGDLSTQGSGAGKPSTSTISSTGMGTTMTLTVDFRTRTGDATVFDDRNGDSYPILRDDPSRHSADSVSLSHEPATQYAGTSSGLRISVRWIMAGLLVGLAAGMILSELEVSSVAARWISLPGDLFLRALKCVVTPYVFCSVAVAIGDIVFVGKVTVVGWQTAKIFAMFWVATVVLGVSVAMAFSPFFRGNKSDVDSLSNAMGFTCANKRLLTTTTNGTVACSTNATVLASATTFAVIDSTNYFAKTGSGVASLSLSEQLMQMITPIVSKNIVASFANSELLSLITFAMVLGAIAGRSYFTRSRRVNYLYLILLQLRNTFFLLMEWTIWLSPLAVVSIVAGSFATNVKFLRTLGEIYPYLLAAISAALLQVLVVYPLIVFLLTRTNPYAHMRHMARAYMFAFASASSLATMPVTLSCVKSARMCSQSAANFVVSIGVSSSISGMGFYLPIALVFLAESSGNGDMITLPRIVGIAVLSLLACTGTPPIPASGLVVISTAYTTLFGELPATAFAYVVAMDFFFDRITTTCNVNDDVMALKIIAETTDETVAQDLLGERV